MLVKGAPELYLPPCQHDGYSHTPLSCVKLSSKTFRISQLNSVEWFFQHSYIYSQSVIQSYDMINFPWNTKNKGVKIHMIWIMIQNACHFTNNIFKLILMYENAWISITNSLGNIFLSTELTIKQQWLRGWLSTEQLTRHYLDQW